MESSQTKPQTSTPDAVAHTPLLRQLASEAASASDRLAKFLSTDEGAQAAVLLLLYANGEPTGEKDMFAFIELATGASVSLALFSNVADGKMAARLDGGELAFSMTEAGREDAQALIAAARERRAD